jgi:hypothetical protein
VDISSPYLQLVIMAVRDALKLAGQECEAQGDNPDAGLEDYMAQLDLLQSELKREYERGRAAGEQLLPYDLVVGQTRFRKL